MANTNMFKITIDDKDYTSHVPFPLKWIEALDETLDYSRISIQSLNKEIFRPLTSIEILMTDRKGTNFVINEVISTDSATEVPVGSGKYNHELFSIEQTKILEGIVMPALTFTNDLGREFVHGNQPIDVEISKYKSSQSYMINVNPDENVVNEITNSNQPKGVGQTFTFPSFGKMFPSARGYICNWDIYVFNPQNKMIKNEGGFYDRPYPAIKHSSLDNTDLTVTLEEGTYRAKYILANMSSSTTDNSKPEIETIVEFSFRVVENYEPLPKWNITTVINRMLNVAESHLASEQPRFCLNAQQAEEFSKIDAFDFIDTPEFMVPSGTLREGLDIIGGYIHGMVRLRGNEIYYDMLGGTEQAELYKKNYPYVSKKYAQNIESFCTNLDSTVDNFVCALDDKQGTIIEPYNDGYETVRTETVYARIEEGNMYIATQFPIQKIKSVKIGFVNGIDGRVGDITPFIYEEAEYGRLSSYSGKYPTSKAFALYYTQGTKNIYGLNFKVPDATAGNVFSRYSIVNIINTKKETNLNSVNYQLLAFQVEYVPIFRARVQQTKQYIGDFKQPRALCYNQGANLVETRYFGENMKGAVARMGNVECVITFHLQDFTLLPKCGQLWGDDYYISQIAYELYPQFLKCEISLSEDFNRLSQYIGINSVKRFYEVSEKQAYASDRKYTDYIVIGDRVIEDTTLMTIAPIKQIFTQEGTHDSISQIFAEGVKTSGESLNLRKVLLPVVSSAFGNAMCFSMTYKDNYSAGAQSIYETAGGAQGYYTNDVPYANYYGRFPALKFSMYAKQAAPISAGIEQSIGKFIPEWTGNAPENPIIETPTNNPLIIEKDGAEIISLNYVLEFVTNRKNYIIGSALARNCPLVRGTDSKRFAALYVLPQRISKFAARVPLDSATKITEYKKDSDIPGHSYTKTIRFNNFASPVSGAAWAIVDDSSGELLIGSNEPITAGQTVSMPYMTLRHNIFNL